MLQRLRFSLRLARGMQPRASRPGHQYRAFVSYSHAMDGRLAPSLRTALHRFAKPWYSLRAVKVFLDESSLSVTPALWPAIEQALAGSEFFILLASPQAAKSAWVRREVAYWCASKATDRFLIVLTDGRLVWDPAAGDFDWQATDALPSSLASTFADEPRFVDLRWARAEEHLSLTHPRFRDCVADLAAPLHGRAKDDLVGEDVRQYRRTRRLARAAAATLCALTLLAMAASVIAFAQRRQAIRERVQATIQRNTAISRQLAAEGALEVGRRRSSALLLALQALNTSETVEARNVLLSALQRDPMRAAYLPATDRVLSVAVGRVKNARMLVAAGAADGRVTIADLQTPSVIATVGNGQAASQAVSFSPDGHLLAEATRDGDVRLWDTKTWKSVRTLVGHGALNAVAFDPTGELIAAGSDDETVILWRVGGGRPFATLDVHRGEVFDLRFSPDGRTLASASDDGKVILWDVARRVPRGRPLASGADTIFSVAFSPDGRTIAAGQDDGTVVLWDAVAGTRVGVPLSGLGAAGEVRTLAYEPDGRSLVAGGGDQVVVLGGEHLRERRVVLDAQSGVNAVALAADGRTLVTGADDRMVGVWNLDSTIPLGTAIAKSTSHVNDMAIRADGLLVTGSDDGTIELIDSHRREVVDIVAVASRPVRSVAFSPGEGRLLAIRVDDGTTVLWDLGQRRQRATLPATAGTGMVVPAMAFNPAGTVLAVAARGAGNDLGDGWVTRWDVRTLHPVGDPLRIRYLGGGINDLAFTPDGTTLAVSGPDVVVWWYLDRPPSNARVIKESGGVFSPDRRTMASVSDNQAIRLWDVEKGTPAGDDLLGHGSDVIDLAFAPDGRTLAASHVDGSVRLWDLQARTALGEPLRAHTEPVRHLAFSPDGHFLASVDADGMIVLWDVDPRGWQTRACAKVAPLATASTAGLRPAEVAPDVCKHASREGQRG